MHAHPEPPPPPAAGAPAGALAFLRSAVRDATAGVAIVDGRDARLAVLYANDSFLEFAQRARLPAEDFLLGDVTGLGPALEAVVAAAVGSAEGFARRRVAQRQGSSVQPVFVSAERVLVDGAGPFHVVVIRDGADDEAPDDGDDAAARFARAAGASGDGYWEWNLLTGSAWYGPNVCELLGLEPTALGTAFATFRDLVHEADRMLLLQAIRLHLEQRQPFDVEVRIRGGADPWRTFRLRGSASRDAAGRPVQLAGRLEDVEDRRRAEHGLRRAAALLRGTLDGLAPAVGVLDGAGELVEINRAWREYPGDRALIGLRYGFGEDYVRLCRGAGERCAAGPAVATGVEDVLAGTRDEFELCYVVDAGGAARHLSMRVQAFDLDGRRGAIVVHEDVTALDEARAAARAAEEFYELILDSVPLHIAYVNRHRELVYANRSYEEWFQLPLAALAGRRLEHLTSPENYRQIAPRVEAVLAGRHVEFQAKARRGEEERELAVSYLPHVAQGETLGFFSVARDVTQQKRLELELRHAQKMEAVGQLTGGIAHDFNNLLSVVIGNLQLLERPLKGEQRLATLAATALKAALRGADLTRRLLAFSRQQVLEPRVLAPNQVIAGMQELVRRTLGGTIEVGAELDPDAWCVFVDAGQLENSLLNLAINARDAMPDGGQVTLATRNVELAEDDPARHPKLPPGEYVEVAVADTGTGMPPEVLKRAFEPFFTTKDLGKGTGLGLAMVYGFAEQSGGIATIASEPGRGTRVSLWFPRSHLPGAQASDGDGATHELPRGNEAVLVVENDADVRATAASALRVLGYRVLEASTGEQALKELARDDDVALLLCETSLPGGMPASELARRAQALAPELRLLYTPGFAGGVRLRGLPDGADVLPKPYAISELARRVRAALDRAPAREDAPPPESDPAPGVAIARRGATSDDQETDDAR
jgi:PAS domain S-box-containing protein